MALFLKNLLQLTENHRNIYTIIRIHYVIPLLAAVLGLTTIQSANAHTRAWLYGYEAGRYDGIHGPDTIMENDPCTDYGADFPIIVPFHGHDLNLSADDNEDRCDSGYSAGFNATCHIAWADPNANHKIYGCPGISDAMIDKRLAADEKIPANTTRSNQTLIQ